MRFLESDASSFSLSFEISQNLMVIPVWINESAMLRMILDTGISNTIVTELLNSDSVSLNHARAVSVAGLGDGEAIQAYQSENNQIRISNPGNSYSGIQGDGFDVFILLENQFDLSSQLGFPVNGLIGNDILRNFILEIDPVSMLITFWDPEQYNLSRRTKRFSQIPLEINNGKAHLNVKLKQTDGSTVTTKLLIDSGASLAVWISPFTNPWIKIPEITIPAFLGQGLSGEINGVNGRIPELTIGPYTFHNPIISYPDSISITVVSLGGERNGSVGNDIFRRFRAIIDFEHATLYLKPNKWFKDSFTYNRSGMEIDKPMGQLPYIRIFNVVDHSPAAQVGIKPGDQLKSLNFIPAYQLNLDEINSFLHGHAGTIIRVELIRDGQSIKTRFRLAGAI